MSLAKPTPLTGMGDIKGSIYDFEKAGDVLEKHTHDETNAHITIVAKGSIKAYSHDWELVIPAGKVANFAPNQPHEFMALEDDTRIVNILKKFGGVVNDYAQEQPIQINLVDEALPEHEIVHL
jgi:quercetin dioxygenase-like cupin family protein